MGLDYVPDNYDAFVENERRNRHWDSYYHYLNECESGESEEDIDE